MMVLHAGGSEPATGTRTAMQRAPLRRRRSSKGTIAGFAFGKGDGPGTANENNSDLPESVSGSQGHNSVSSSSNQPQHTTDVTQGPTKPCHTARLALLCAQNAVRMGARTQLFLSPPGRVRSELQAKLRQRLRGHPNNSTFKRLLGNVDSGGYYGLDKLLGTTSEDFDALEENALLNSNSYDMDSDEDASSGDDDEMRGIDELFSEESASLDDDAKYAALREPLFSPNGAENGMSNANSGPMAALGSNTAGRLPFNRRKIRFFDSITATESTAARKYLQQEMRRSRKRSGILLARHLRRVRREELRKQKQEKGEPIDSIVETDNESPEEKALLYGGVSPFQSTMTPAMAAALLLESLSINPLESLEGMAKCYDGIVDAGIALLDIQAHEPKASSDDERPRPTRSEIMNALAPLLITSLEQPSGETILMLAKLRRMCGTARYQRRFVQRVGPCLMRPARAAMWCLRHQNDMEAILAATELIFDSAFDIFRKGWYERGQLLLQDSKRAQTLNTAAQQLRSLSSEPSDGFGLGLGPGNRRRLLAVAKKKDVSGVSNEPLAEWEVIAVDRQIRISISNLMTMDWSRSAIQSEVPRPMYRRSSYLAASKRLGTVPQLTSTEMSPKAIPSSPRSPHRVITTIPKAPSSPPNLPNVGNLSSNGTDVIENVFGPSFAVSPVAPQEQRSTSPVPASMPTSPPPPRKDDQDAVNAYSTFTPPRSPRSPKKSDIEPFKTTEQPAPIVPTSPKRNKVGGREAVNSVPVSSANMPLSPLSIGSSAGHELISYKPSPSAASVSSMNSGPPAHYRTLTSTAAERKRTVAACRALRAQIQRFEDAFSQLHGRAPKGAAERAPLATTYAQYREWKRAIRADAACRIQALFRGSRTRWMLLRSNNPMVTRIVVRRAGRSGGPGRDHLTIPAEIGQSGADRQNNVAHTDAYGRPTGPQWASNHVRPRTNSGDRSTSSDSYMGGPGAQKAGVPGPTSGPLPSDHADLMNLSLAELQARKRDLKQQLKQYDMNFARRHGRMPVKAEKEPIRHLYESYNALKGMISQIEQEGRQLQTPSQSPAPSPVSQRTVSPPSGSDSGSGNEESPSRTSPLPARARRKVPKASSPPIGSTPTPVAAPSQDLAALKAEKSQLHQMLRSYEKEFFKEHKRQVSSFADIKPVASQYRRYKDIKKAIAQLQQSEK